MVNYKNKYETSQQTIKDRYAIFEVPYLGIDNDDYVNGQGFCCNDTPQGAGTKAAMQNDNPELFQYYYHSDHVGSTSLITNLDGEVVQHVEYVPFGEVFIEERNNTWNTPYLFNAKELDEETGLYYYGARYYDSRISLWLSADPLQEKYPNVSTYAYCVQNPIRYKDTDGRDGMVTGSGTREDPYVITAKYYYQNASLNKDQLNGLNSAISEYNNSGRRGLVNIRNSDGTRSYVRYNLSAEGVNDVNEARLTTAFETTSGDTRYYGNIVGTEPNVGGTGDEYGSANNFRVDFNVANINEQIEKGMSSNLLNRGVAIHEIGHNLGGEHSDGTPVMDMIRITTTKSQMGGRNTVSYSYPSMSNRFTKIIFDKRDTKKPDMSAGRMWTRKL